MANRGIQRGRGFNAPLGWQTNPITQGGAGYGFISGPYPTQPWIGKTNRPTMRGNVVIRAPSHGQNGALTLIDNAGAVDGIPSFNGLKQLFEIDDGAGVPIFAVANAGGATVYGDQLSATAGATGQPAITLDGRTVPGSIYGHAGTGNHLYLLQGTPTGGALSFNPLASAVGDWAINFSATASPFIYRCTVAGHPGTWVTVL